LDSAALFQRRSHSSRSQYNRIIGDIVNEEHSTRLSPRRMVNMEKEILQIIKDREESG
jgi:septum formation topological specificity factor MinE